MLLAIAISTVLSIDVEWSSTFQGRTYGPITTHITRSGSDFLLNGNPVSGSAVQTLVDALQAPAMSEPTADSLRLGAATLDSLETTSMQDCDGVSATQAAQDVYRRRFTDPTALASFLRSYYAKPPTPKTLVPALRITMMSSDGQVTASSSSSKAGMLPFTIARGGTTVTTYNASLSEAVGALLPRSTASMLLQLDSVSREWAGAICDEDMRQIAFEDALPQTMAFAQAHGLVVHGFVNGDPAESLHATVWKADNPRIAMGYNADAGGGEAASVIALTSASNTLHRVSVIPWVQRALAKNPDATVNVDDPSMNGNFLEAFEIEQLRKAGFGKEASVLASNFRVAQSFWVWLKPDKEASQWYLMPNGDALLVHYLPAEVSLPLDPQTNALIHRRGKLFGKTPTITVGAIVTPAGALVP